MYAVERMADALERATPAREAEAKGSWHPLGVWQPVNAAAERERQRAERAERELAEAISTQGTIATARDEYYRRFKDAERKLAEARAERDENYLSKCHTEDECCRIEVECGEATLALKAARASAEKLREALEKYGKHRLSCARSNDFRSDPCTCGLQSALDQAGDA